MLLPAVGVAREQPFEKLVLGAEVAVDEPVRDAGLLGDRAQRNVVGAGGGEESLRGVQHGIGDLVTARGAGWGGEMLISDLLDRCSQWLHDSPCRPVTDVEGAVTACDSP